jgi:hypothetical protein
MLTARDELKHFADSLSEGECERVLELLYATFPEQPANGDGDAADEPQIFPFLPLAPHHAGG